MTKLHEVKNPLGEEFEQGSNDNKVEAKFVNNEPYVHVQPKGSNKALKKVSSPKINLLTTANSNVMDTNDNNTQSNVNNTQANNTIISNPLNTSIEKNEIKEVVNVSKQPVITNQPSLNKVNQPIRNVFPIPKTNTSQTNVNNNQAPQQIIPSDKTNQTQIPQQITSTNNSQPSQPNQTHQVVNQQNSINQINPLKHNTDQEYIYNFKILAQSQILNNTKRMKL